MTSAVHNDTTTETYIAAVRDLVIAQAGAAGDITAEQAEQLQHAKLLYGVGRHGYRGICHFEAWDNHIGKVAVVEIAASAQESAVQLAGTVVHELAHVLAGYEAAHGKEWKDTAKLLGFRIRPAAAGQVYSLAMFQPRLRHAIAEAAARITDGKPGFAAAGLVVRPKPCSTGVGAKGGKSRGTGSGSRLRLYECECDKPVKVRVASDSFAATCEHCSALFHRA